MIFTNYAIIIIIIKIIPIFVTIFKVSRRTLIYKKVAMSLHQNIISEMYRMLKKCLQNVMKNQAYKKNKKSQWNIGSKMRSGSFKP